MRLTFFTAKEKPALASVMNRSTTDYGEGLVNADRDCIIDSDPNRILNSLVNVAQEETSLKTSSTTPRLQEVNHVTRAGVARGNGVLPASADEVNDLVNASGARGEDAAQRRRQIPADQSTTNSYPEYFQTWSPFVNFFTFACVSIAMLIYLCIYVTILEDRIEALRVVVVSQQNGRRMASGDEQTGNNHERYDQLFYRDDDATLGDGSSVGGHGEEEKMHMKRGRKMRSTKDFAREVDPSKKTVSEAASDDSRHQNRQLNPSGPLAFRQHPHHPRRPKRQSGSGCSNSCPAGPKGDSGEPGMQGVRGRKGESGGITGPPGRDGVPGPMGLDGTKGEPGGIGPRGDEGGIGPNGEDGFDGLPGRKGERGFPGLPSGISMAKFTELKGEAGSKGTPGPPGHPGSRGLDGFDGLPGPPGEEGEPGNPGGPGPRGSSGSTGSKGESGTSTKSDRGHPQGPRGTSGK